MPAREKENQIKKIVLAYSGGLDTSIIIPWLKERYPGALVTAVCVNVGQKDDFTKMKAKAKASGAAKFILVDAREEFAKDYLFPMLRSGAVYEGKYLMGTSIARPLQAKHQALIALKEKADAVAHGCTGKGNDQVRFELTYRAVAPGLTVIAPWRVWNIRSREEAIEYAEKHGIPLGNISKKNIYSRDENMWHLSHEGAELEDPWNRPEERMFQLSVSPKSAPDRETEIVLDFEKSVPVALNGKKAKPVELIVALNKLGGENGIGRADVVETRTVGMKAHGVYETPAGTILYRALRELEMLCLDADSLHQKSLLAVQYAELVYQGKWFTPLREAIDAFMEEACRYVTGSVRLVLYKGNVIVAGRQSPYALYSEDLASFGATSYDHGDATGFIKLFGLPVEVGALAHKKKK